MLDSNERDDIGEEDFAMVRGFSARDRVRDTASDIEKRMACEKLSEKEFGAVRRQTLLQIRGQNDEYQSSNNEYGSMPKLEEGEDEYKIMASHSEVIEKKGKKIDTE